jgi:hypothetical protein
LDFLYAREPRAALVPRLPWAGLFMGLWPARRKHNADTECDDCGERFPLWDALEKKFASDAVRRQVEELQADDLAKLSTRRRGKLLVLDVGARITSANQKWMEVPGDEDDGIDMLVEFTDEDGNGIGKGLCLQLKAGNCRLGHQTE